MKRAVTHAIIPAAGLGTRYFPISSYNAKELVRVNRVPNLHRAVREAVLAAAESVVIVTDDVKLLAFNGLFQKDGKFEQLMNETPEKFTQVQRDWFKELQFLGTRVRFAVQSKPYGLGHAVLTGLQEIPRDASAMILLPDEAWFRGENVLRSMIAIHKRNGAHVLSGEFVGSGASAFGCIDLEGTKVMSNGRGKVAGLVEKPKDRESGYVIAGRYVVGPQLRAALEDGMALAFEAHAATGAKIDVDLTKALSAEISVGRGPGVVEVPPDTRFDVGNEAGFKVADAALERLEGEVLPDPAILRMADRVEPQAIDALGH